MGVSTNGEIWFGVVLDEGAELPWDGYDFESWWHEVVQGLPPWDHAGGESYAAWEARRAKPPAQLVNVCSLDYPMWALAVPGSVRTARRGYPERFDPADLTVSDEAGTAFVAFLREHLTDESWDMPGWHLSSEWC